MRVLVKAFGCKLTQCEAGILEQRLISEGFSVVLTPPVDAVIVCGCTVTARADYKVRQFFRRIKRECDTARLFLSGCSAQSIDQSDLKELGVEKVFPTNLPTPIIDYLNNSLAIQPSDDNIIFQSTTRTRGFVKIQDGCDQFCSYCIVPIVRGRECSEKLSEIIDNINVMIGNGVKEIVLTGVHIGRYSSEDHNLADLCRKIINETDIFRMRLTSIEPTELSDELLSVISGTNKIAPHLHVPLQSGSNNILIKMNRHYSSDYFRSVINKVHKYVNNIGIGVDVIVGFPGETDEDFMRTFDLLNTLQISYLHVFRFSARRGTKAYQMNDTIPESVKRNRMEKLLTLKNDLKRRFAETQLGKTQEVIIEEVDKSGICSGWTGNYIRAQFLSDYISVNNIVSLEPLSYESDVINCRIKDIIL